MRNLKLERPIVFFDLETTGTDIKSDRIIEIYAKKINLDKSTEEFYTRVNPIIPVSAGATKVHGIKTEDINDSPRFSEIAMGLYKFIKDCDLGGYNCINFDIPMLIEEMTRENIMFNPVSKNIIDPYKIIVKKESNKLESVYKRYFGEDFDDKHSAKADIDATIRVFEKQLEKYDLTDVNEISTLVRGDVSEKKFIDFKGVFYKKDDEYYYGIGKNVNQKVKEHIDYLDWIVSTSSHTNNVKLVGKKLLEHFTEK